MELKNLENWNPKKVHGLSPKSPKSLVRNLKSEVLFEILSPKSFVRNLKVKSHYLNKSQRVLPDLKSDSSSPKSPKSLIRNLKSEVLFEITSPKSFAGNLKVKSQYPNKSQRESTDLKSEVLLGISSPKSSVRKLKVKSQYLNESQRVLLKSQVIPTVPTVVRSQRLRSQVPGPYLAISLNHGIDLYKSTSFRVSEESRISSSEYTNTILSIQEYSQVNSSNHDDLRISEP